MARAGLASVALVAACGSDKASDGASSGGFGSPGSAGQAARTVDVRIKATGYDPTALNVAKGETVTFNVTNDDAALHEFVIGDAKAQDAYEKTMADMSTTDTMKMPDTPSIIEVEPGKSKTITWSFPNEETSVIYGSHQPGDYKKFKGTITVK
ncbi:MAG: cupredoxin domain-containing protein [Acidimicrobiales bacterium]